MSDVRENLRDFGRTKKEFRGNNKEVMGEFSDFIDE